MKLRGISSITESKNPEITDSPLKMSSSSRLKRLFYEKESPRVHRQEKKQMVTLSHMIDKSMIFYRICNRGSVFKVARRAAFSPITQQKLEIVHRDFSHSKNEVNNHARTLSFEQAPIKWINSFEVSKEIVQKFQASKIKREKKFKVIAKINREKHGIHTKHKSQPFLPSIKKVNAKQ